MWDEGIEPTTSKLRRRVNEKGKIKRKENKGQVRESNPRPLGGLWNKLKIKRACGSLIPQPHGLCELDKENLMKKIKEAICVR